MRLKGVKPEQQPWKIAIEKPVNNERAVQRILVPSDIGVATTRNGKALPMLQGPSKLQCPATTDLIVNRFVHPNLRDQRVI